MQVKNSSFVRKKEVLNDIAILINKNAE